jgi:hypothetical protein
LLMKDTNAFTQHGATGVALFLDLDGCTHSRFL